MADWQFPEWIGFIALWFVTLMNGLEEGKGRWPKTLGKVPSLKGLWAFLPLALLILATGILVWRAVFSKPDIQAAPPPNSIEAIRLQIDPPSSIGTWAIRPDRWFSIELKSTDLLLPWAEKYDLIAIGQMNFSNIDRMTNKGIAKSIRYTVDGGAVNIAVQIPQEQFDLIPYGSETTAEGAIYLVPKSVDLAKITSLQTAETLGALFVVRRVMNIRQTKLPPRRLDEAAKKKFLSEIPKNRPVTVTFLSGDEPRVFAQEIAEFLKANSYQVAGPATLLLAGPPRQTLINLNLDDLKKPTEITVGANVPTNPP